MKGCVSCGRVTVDVRNDQGYGELFDSDDFERLSDFVAAIMKETLFQAEE